MSLVRAVVHRRVRMTRGKIIYIDKDMMVYSTLDFNGDMYPDEDMGYGREVVDAFRNRRLSSADRFTSFVVDFDRRHFSGGVDSESELISASYCNPEKGMDLSGNLTDYLYVINESGEAVRLHAGDKNTSMLSTGKMAIFNFESLQEIMEKKPEGTEGIDKSSIKVTWVTMDICVEDDVLEYLRAYCEVNKISFNEMALVALMKLVIFDKVNTIREQEKEIERLENEIN
jgi:hypothetical protein